MALRGGDIAKITSEVAGLIKNPLMVLDSNWSLLAYQDCKENLFPLDKYLFLKKGQQVFSPSFIKDIPTSVNEWDKSIQREYLLGGRPITCRIRPIAVDRHIYGYFVVWECVRKLKKIDYIALEHASTITALERIKQKEVEETRHRIRTDFFDDLLSGKIESINAVKNLGEIHGLETCRASVCMVVKIDQYEKFIGEDFYSDKKRLNEIKKQIRYLVEQEAAKHNRSMITLFRGNDVILISQLEPQDEVIPFKDFIKEYVENLHSLIEKELKDIKFSIGIGKIYDNILELSKSFNQAIEAINVGRKVCKDRIIANFEDFMVYHLLNSVVNKKDMQDFFESTIGKLIKYDNENSTEFVKTLEVLFKCKGNISEAAKEMFMHRNTLIYRLDKIKSILNVDLEDAESLLEIQLGIRAMRILDSYPGRISV